MRRLDRLIAFDAEAGLLRCEAGVTLAEILGAHRAARLVPAGGAGHPLGVGGRGHRERHPRQEPPPRRHLRRPRDPARAAPLDAASGCVCAPERTRLFQATVGGLGLTGLITWAEIRLKRIAGPGIAMERIRFPGLDAFFELAAEDHAFEYTVAWVDCLARGPRLGRGIYMRGDHAPASSGPAPSPLGAARLTVPVDAPAGLLNRVTLALFNEAYYGRQLASRRRQRRPLRPVLLPARRRGRLDPALRAAEASCSTSASCPRRASGRADPDDLRAHRALGRGRPRWACSSDSATGPLARHALVPPARARPWPWTSPSAGDRPFALLDDLDAIVREAGGAVYPAKDARMSPESFRAFFPRLDRFRPHQDPRFSSSFWRRVHAS